MNHCGIAKKLCSQCVYLLCIKLRLTIAVTTHGALNLTHVAIPDAVAAATPVAFQIGLHTTNLLRHFGGPQITTGFL